MRYLLDTNTCIGWLRGNQPALITRIQQTAPNDIALCSIVIAELLYGSARSDPAHQTNNRNRVEQLRKHFVSLPVDDVAAEQYGLIRAHLATLGTPIGPNDLMIASIAKSQGLTLVTHNVAEFLRVPGLVIDDWQID